MRPTRKERDSKKGFIFTTVELRQKLNNLKQNKNFTFKNGKVATPDELINFMYKINFLMARKELENGVIQRKYYEENRYLLSNSVNYGYDWEVHLVFRWALQPEGIEDVFKTVRMMECD